MSKLWVKFEKIRSTQVSTADCQNVEDFLEACKKKLSPPLDNIPVFELTLSTTDSTLEPYDLCPDLLLIDLPSQPGYTPNNFKNPLLLNIITKSPVASRSSSSSSLTNKPPHPDRKRRWDRLNEAFVNNKKRNTSKDSIGYSNISWKEVKDLLAPTSYIQEQKEIPEDSLDFLYKYISAVTVTFGSILTGKEAKRLHFIAPVLICVSYLFNGDVQISAEEDLEGNLVKAHGHFEFVLRRHNKYVCIVEAKNEDMEQGMAQDLVGCEVAAEVGELDCVYGIVTDYMRWVFFRSLNDKIEEDFSSLKFSHGITEKQSLKEIVGKIYAILSGDE
jgi:hypothetical protein